MRRLVLSHTIQHVIPNVYTEFQNSRSSKYCEILTEESYIQKQTHEHTRTLKHCYGKGKNIYTMCTSYAESINRIESKYCCKTISVVRHVQTTQQAHNVEAASIQRLGTASSLLLTVPKVNKKLAAVPKLWNNILCLLGSLNMSYNRCSFATIFWFNSVYTPLQFLFTGFVSFELLLFLCSFLFRLLEHFYEKLMW